MYENEENLRAFFNAIDDFLFVLDDSFNFVWTNDVVLKRLGYERGELAGKSVNLVYPQYEKESIARILVEAAVQNSVFYPIPYVSRQGERFFVETRVFRGCWSRRDAFFVVSRDVSALRASEEKFSKAFYSSSVLMMISTLKESRIVDVNDSILRILGYTKDEMIGKAPLELNLYENVTDREIIHKHVREKGYVTDYEMAVRTKDGEIRHGLFSIDLVEIGGETCLLTAVTDITCRKRNEEKLKQAYAELEGKNRLIEIRNSELVIANKIIEEKAAQIRENSRHKSEFIANMSHELRTPMNNISLLSMLLSDNREKNLSQRQLEYARTISSSCKDLLYLINDLLDISRAESGRMEIVEADTFISDFKEKLEMDFLPLAEHSGLDFSVCIDGRVPDSIVTDMRRVDQILKNLLSNAFRFTEYGEIRVTISMACDEAVLKQIGLSGLDPLQTITFTVSDTGRGISTDKQALIFEMYRQAEATTNRDYGGSGLGLPISRVMAQLLGGDIFLKSEPGKGSRFTLYLPVRKHGLDKAQEVKLSGKTCGEFHPASIRAGSQVLKERKILIIDDDMRNVYSLISVLEACGARVGVGSNGEKGLEFLRKNPDTDLVLLDMVMPRMDGYRVISEIRGDKRICHIPVVAVTARAMPGERETILGSGVDAYLAKPVNIDELFSVMDKFI